MRFRSPAAVHSQRVALTPSQNVRPNACIFLQVAGNIHRPEYWGYVQFAEEPAGSAPAPFVKNPNERVK